jgi:PTH1 family peptidyl-tRNA hydrolase
MLNLLKKRLKKITQKKVNKVYKLCIVGLGNPGSKYNGTRHNVGKDWLIDISQQYFKEFQNKPKYEAEFGESHNAETLWITPSNFVNESGRTISKILRSHNLDTNMFLIIHDDLDLEPGELKIKEGGGHGGHNGLRDIIKRTGKSDFMRLRVGIGHPGMKNEVTNWVLNKFSPNEKKSIDNAYSKFVDVFELIINNQLQKVQKILHTK